VGLTKLGFEAFAFGNIGHDDIDDWLSVGLYGDALQLGIKEGPALSLQHELAGPPGRCLQHLPYVEVECILRLGMDEEGKGLLDEKASFNTEEAARGEVRPGDEPRLIEGQVTERGQIVQLCIQSVTLPVAPGMCEAPRSASQARSD